jgi:HAMP domain
MSMGSDGRTVSADGKLWRLMVVRTPIGVTVEVGALAQSISARAARLRTVVIWTGIAGLLVVLLGTAITSRFALRPLRELASKAGKVRGTDDLAVRLRVPGQPEEVAVLAEELDLMLGRSRRGRGRARGGPASGPALSPVAAARPPAAVG